MNPLTDGLGKDTHAAERKTRGPVWMIGFVNLIITSSMVN